MIIPAETIRNNAKDWAEKKGTVDNCPYIDGRDRYIWKQAFRHAEFCV